MGYLDYYRYQAQARGVADLADIIRAGRTKAHVYDRIVLPWLPSDKSAPVAELACGHGSFLWWLHEKAYSRITGIDSSPEQTALARQLEVTVLEDDVNRWLASQPAGSWIVLVGIDLIEHLSKDDLMTLLDQAHRVLRPAGRLILRYPNGDSPLVGMNLFNDITHVWTYTPNCLDTLARMHRFSGTQFKDESADALRDRRWLKVPLSRLSQFILRLMFRAATREDVRYWSPHLWACLEK